MTIYDAELDFPTYSNDPGKVICLYFIPRSASNFLADQMRQTGKLGYPLEYFSYLNTQRLTLRLLKYGDFPNSLLRVRTSPNGVFSYKWNTGFPYEPLNPDYAIFLDRRDRWAQAKSYCIAKKTDEWMKINNQDYQPTHDEISKEFDFLDEIRHNTLSIVSKRDHVRLDFEDVIERPGEVVQHIMGFCGA